MDLASERTRRKNRSSSNLNHLSLAPLTVKLPIDDDEPLDFDSSYMVPPAQSSYLQGKSAPTTPRLLSRSPAGPRSRSRHRRTPSAPGATLSKSKSSTYLDGSGHVRHTPTGTMTPGRRRDDTAGIKDRSDSDWLLRAGALMSSEARESKGQAWLVSRQSSTSISGMRDADDEAFEQELARERELASHHASRRGSLEDATPSLSRYNSRRASRINSRSNSRSHSMANVRDHVFTPTEERAGDDYFVTDGTLSGPDFVNLDEKLEELERDGTQDDEAIVRRLVRRGHAGDGSWIGNMLGWSLFSVEENEDESEDESMADTLSQASRAKTSMRSLGGVAGDIDDRIPPPMADEGGWKDAAWLLTVATKVMF